MLVGTCQLAALVFDLFEQAHVVDSNRRWRGECFEERNDLGRECARTSTTDGQGANHLTLVQVRHAEGTHARTTQNVDHGRWLGTVDVSDLHGFAAQPLDHRAEWAAHARARYAPRSYCAALRDEIRPVVLSYS